jgi:diadenosine tetraphosphate (Ap4A) HIT family hydrolase
VLLMNDANFPWLIVVPRHAGAVEIFDLGAAARTQLTGEVALLAQILKELTGCDKINIAAIGNVVPQLHVHVIARRRDDPAWPRPVWGALPPRPYGQAERDRLIEAIRRRIDLG